LIKDSENTQRVSLGEGIHHIWIQTAAIMTTAVIGENPKKLHNIVKILQIDRFVCLHCHAKINNNNIYNAHTILDHSSTGITRSNPGRGKDVCGIVLCTHKSRDGPIPRLRNPDKYLKILRWLSLSTFYR
jgi:hypothetical protein